MKNLKIIPNEKGEKFTFKAANLSQEEKESRVKTFNEWEKNKNFNGVVLTSEDGSIIFNPITSHPAQ